MFLYKGKKLWEGDNTNIIDTKVPELKEFLFANQFIKNIKVDEANG
jgi:phospholipid/cholesterol/gamma-HCH transport system ATP-binding protein